ncbi:methylmalonyl-CoA mutase family protein [Lysinibacillus piscis]|uniref:Methylmalonyl-CoA mutase alpha/beta chain catalytic domain-containing protein n=1 Tax=Lysinibacillus piscis TaxID=2518931 RepID=A0ABQ5NKY6_9BACI|nr:methylmalonyl-CoA mutase family protein [Lysinibacillus sp. KH24]GLC88788.1 hypothetical protein LYSBPC_19150 [Lysinibacillus sp. KH24]
MKNIEFAKPSYAAWQGEALKALKGKPFESLLTKTNEGITIEPLYTQEQLIEKMGAELEQQVSTIRSFQQTATFQLAQQLYAETSEAFFAQLENGLQRGNEVITIDSRVSFDWTEDVLTKLSAYLLNHPFKLMVTNASDPLLKVFDVLKEEQCQIVKGFIVAQEAISYDHLPNVRSIGADTTVYHYEGANAVQELAYALALAAKEATKLQDFEAFTKKFYVSFAVDTQFFTEIAKLRAFKVLWKAFTSAYGVSTTMRVPIVAETSLRSFSKLDSYVNLLRAGNEALAAFIGGIDVLTVHPHDILTQPTEQSVRIARNVSLVLTEETTISKVKDPAGGAYFIESLTADLVKAAWALFLEIEAAGGFDVYTASGQLTQEVEAVHQARLQAVQTRKHSLIGTNIYANPADVLTQATNPLYSHMKRVAEPFEQLRAEMTAAQVKTAILTAGTFKNAKPRVDFVTGFLHTVGLVPEHSVPMETVGEAIAWLQSVQANYVVIAGNDEDTKAMLDAILAAKPAHILVDVAGKFKEQEAQWQAQGLNGFIFAGQNIIEKLTNVLVRVKEVQ